MAESLPALNLPTSMHGVIVVEIKSPDAKAPKVAERLSSRGKSARSETYDLYERLLRAAELKDEAITPVKAIHHNKEVATKKALHVMGEQQRRTYLQAKAKAKELRAKQMRQHALEEVCDKAYQVTKKQAAVASEVHVRDVKQKEALLTKTFVKQVSASEKRMAHLQEKQQNAAAQAAKAQRALDRRMSQEQMEREERSSKLEEKMTAAEERRARDMATKLARLQSGKGLRRAQTWADDGDAAPDTGLLKELEERMEGASIRRQASLQHRALRASSMNTAPARTGTSLRALWAPDRHAAAALRRSITLQTKRETAAAHIEHVADVVAVKQLADAERTAAMSMHMADKQKRAAAQAEAALTARAKGTSAFIEEMQLNEAVSR